MPWIGDVYPIPGAGPTNPIVLSSARQSVTRWIPLGHANGNFDAASGNYLQKVCYTTGEQKLLNLVTGSNTKTCFNRNVTYQNIRLRHGPDLNWTAYRSLPHFQFTKNFYFLPNIFAVNAAVNLLLLQ